MIYYDIDSMILFVYICVCDTISKRKKSLKVAMFYDQHL